MTSGSAQVDTRQCPSCHDTVPLAEFCGACGARFDAPVSRWSVLLRPAVYTTAHREPVWMPRVSSTYLPRLPAETRRPFRIGLILVLIAMVALVAAGANGALGVTATIGWPLLFFIYVWQSDVFRDVPLRIMAVAMLVGVGLGVGWFLIAGKWLARSYGVSTASGFLLIGELNAGLLISVVGGVLMVVPAVVARLFPMPVREALDGFVIGTFGALWYATAATTTAVAPQFVEGLLEGHNATRMLEDAITYGVVSPIVTAAGGGLVGMSLWFRPDRRPGRNPRLARAMMTACTVLGAPLYMLVWIVDGAGLPHVTELAIKLTLALLALLLLRCGVQFALLHEAPDPATQRPVLCVHCQRVVPDMAFCSACGAAARASSRSSRRLRHEFPPSPAPQPAR